ncbi:MBL fold metallo-hydrolase [Saprospira grandis]|uniref:Metal-dependent hydrolase n=1 Tax=Saprospira grandis (strain Lewin) TaxID=984262 RepID=H6KZ66_SAPGL|nr:MBL fold metallo-hydrolase [Saprospira grandis]AFC24456.1 metal-dependent hydrolase [Saprospira grandis str. Lewin]
MKIRFLGTGTSQGVPVIGCDCEVCQSKDPRNQRLRVSILVEHQGQRVVIDSGPDFRAQMLAAQVDRLDALVITHEHRDHVAGLDDVRPFNFRQQMDMPLYATTRVQKALKESFAYIFAADYPGVPRVLLQTVEKNQPFSLIGLNWMPLEYSHGRLPVMGYRIGNFAYLTDFKAMPEDQYAYLQGLDTLVISALHHEEHYSHITLAQALEEIKRIGPKRAYITHISHYMGLHEEQEAQLPPHIRFAYDGLEIEVD